MAERKLISTKMQYVFAFIPFFGFFGVVFCGFYNFKNVKGKGYFYIFGYGLLVGIPVVILMGLLAFITSSLVAPFLAGAQTDPNIIMIATIAYTIETVVSMLLGVFYAIWLQNRLLKRIESKESEADIQ